MKKYWKHFVTITKHKWVVMINCIKAGITWRGLTHDLSKYGIVQNKTYIYKIQTNATFL